MSNLGPLRVLMLLMLFVIVVRLKHVNFSLFVNV